MAVTHNGVVTRLDSLDLDFLLNSSQLSLPLRKSTDNRLSSASATSTSITLDITDITWKNKTSASSSAQPTCYYWRQKLCIVSSPFALFGFPIHLIFNFCKSFLNNNDTLAPCKSKNNSSVSWFRAVTGSRTSARSSVLTTTFAVITTLWTAYTISNIYTLVYHFGILGQLNSRVSTSMLRTFYLVPFVLPTLLTWMYGHRVKHLVEMFDEAKPHLFKLAYINNNEVNPQHLRPTNALSYVNCKLVFVYASIYLALVLQILADYSILRDSVLDHESVIYYCVIALYLLTLPIYTVLCWGLLSEIQLISVYLRSLRIYGIRPSSAIFEQIKLCYKSISKHILIVNRTCKLFMCWALPVVLAFAFVNIINGVMYLTDPLYDWAAELLGYGTTFQDIVLANWNGTALLESPTENVLRFNGNVAPQFVRASAGYLTVGSLKLILTWYTYWQAVKVNDQCKLLNVLLNDFVTNSNVAAASTELYQAFQLLKLYVHSTMEYQSPSLLRIPILACLPYFGKRLHRA